eukprot:6810564-Prymnesium_polylepis.1
MHTEDGGFGQFMQRVQTELFGLPVHLAVGTGAHLVESPMVFDNRSAADQVRTDGCGISLLSQSRTRIAHSDHSFPSGVVVDLW